MSATAFVKPLFKATPHISLLILSLLWAYLTLGTKVRRTRRAFEKQLTAAGMSKEDAKRLSSSYQDLKDNLTATVRQAFTSSFTAVGREYE